MADNELAALQVALIQALRSASCPEEALSLLAAASLSESAERWITGSDPRSIETAMALVRRWSELQEDANGSKR